MIDDATDGILGARLLCVDAHEFINLIALAVRQGSTAARRGLDEALPVPLPRDRRARPAETVA